jgi:hypothetical protein
MQKLKITLAYILGGVVLLGVVALAGSLTPLVSSTDTVTMVTLSDIYNRLDDINHTPQDKTTSTTSSPAISMRSLSEIWDHFPTISSSTLATGTTIMGITGTLYGDTDPSKVLNTATYPGSATLGTPSAQFSTSQGGDTDFDSAEGLCSSLEEGGYTDWRLPTVNDFKDVSLLFRSNPIANLPNGVYWSNALRPDLDVCCRMLVSFNNNISDPDFYVRVGTMEGQWANQISCVR